MIDLPLEPPQAHEVRTERLVMRPFTEDEITAVIDGVHLDHFAEEFPIPETVDQLRDVAQAGGYYFTETLYSPLACIELESEKVIGSTGFASAPIDGALEIVGFLVPDRRRMGFAAEGLRSLITLAFEDPEVSVVRASVPENSAHIEDLLKASGFTVAETVGPETEYRCERP